MKALHARTPAPTFATLLSSARVPLPPLQERGREGKVDSVLQGVFKQSSPPRSALQAALRVITKECR